MACTKLLALCLLVVTAQYSNAESDADAESDSFYGYRGYSGGSAVLRSYPAYRRHYYSPYAYRRPHYSYHRPARRYSYRFVDPDPSPDPIPVPEPQVAPAVEEFRHLPEAHVVPAVEDFLRLPEPQVVPAVKEYNYSPEPQFVPAVEEFRRVPEPQVFPAVEEYNYSPEPQFVPAVEEFRHVPAQPIAPTVGAFHELLHVAEDLKAVPAVPVEHARNYGGHDYDVALEPVNAIDYPVEPEPVVAPPVAVAPVDPVPYSTTVVKAVPAAATSSQYHAQDEFGNVAYGYKNPNSYKEEKRDAYGNVVGTYAYIDETGVQKHLSYVADDFGFRVTSTNALPVAPLHPDH